MSIFRSTSVSVPLCLLLLLAGCEGTGGPRDAVDAEEAPTSAAAPAVPPTGSTSRAVSYRCANGREETLTVDVPDLEDLAETINRIQPCEYDNGFEQGTVTFTCASGPVVVRLRGSDGRVVLPRQAAHGNDC